MYRPVNSNRCLLLLALGGLVSSCSSDGESQQGQTAMSLAATLPDDAVPTAEGGVTLTVGADEMEISRVRVVLRRIKLKPVEDNVGHEFSAPARVVDLPLDGSVLELAVSEVPPGQYDRAEIRVHRVDPDDVEDAAAIEGDPEGFADFIAGERYSMIIEGSFNGTPFTFRSREDSDQEIVLAPPVDIAKGDSTNVTLTLLPEAWFLSGEGVLLDPSAAENEDLIDENFKQSIEAFKDDDRDGQSDDSGSR